MRVKQHGLYLCSDCTMYACNGADGAVFENTDATVSGVDALGQNLVPDFNSETGAGILEFSSLPCDGCHTGLVGYRARFAILE
jgi:hypothetical protein